MPNKKILVIDDDRDIRASIREALQLEGYHVSEAENGLVGLRVLEKFSDAELPNCIILDLMMPEMNGEAFLVELKKNPLWKKIPVIVATAKGTPSSPEQIRSSVYRIQKPMELDELYSIVKQHCR